MSPRTAARIAWTAAGLTAAMGIGGLAANALAGLGMTGSSSILLIAWNLMFALVGALIVSKQARNIFGWVFTLVALLITFNLAGTAYAIFAVVKEHGAWPGGVAIAWLAGGWNWIPIIALLVIFIPLLYPTGRLLSSRWRFVVWCAAAFVLLAGIPNALMPGPLFSTPSIRNPLGLEGFGGVLEQVRTVSLIPAIVGVFGALASLVVRFGRARGQERQQLKWFIYGCVLFMAPILAREPVPSQVQQLLTVLLWPALPISVGIAILKYRLYDIDIVINKSLVFGTLAAFITAVYVAIVVGLGGLLGGATRPNLALSILATAIVAVAFQPVRERVQRLANRLVYGKRATPYEVLSQFSHRVAGTYSSEDVLPRMARVLSEGTGASRADVWIRLGDGIAPAASWPLSDGPAPSRIAITGQLLPPVPGISRIVPVRHQGELLGALSINKRPGEALTPIEEKLMTDLAAQAGIVLQSVRLSAELQARVTEISQQAVELKASRQRIVATQDAERRRLERNIHDGAQQNLVALTVKLRLATTLAKRDPERARASVKALQAESDQALETLRALARGIYPPVLREKGLAAAVRAEAEKMPLTAIVSADHLERYPPEVEAAVYFVCLEALQNVTKHAQASRVEINLHSVGHELSFEVSDDGSGFDVRNDARGAGLRNMMDRIEGMGGRLDVRSAAHQGTTVSGTVPIRAMEAAL
ncbi:MAG TPA: histidine kinase [Candidatus Dormibacteraeota bacterium]|nr:histidine kinase [Candidatus Dormibacteraeota bacterium]